MTAMLVAPEIQHDPHTHRRALGGVTDPAEDGKNRREAFPLASFVPGAPVVITKGPLQGVRGVVVGINDNRYLVISITMLGRSVAVELHPEYVRSQYPAAEYHLAYSASRSHVGAIV
jgi:transcription antitermination factor NusG